MDRIDRYRIFVQVAEMGSFIKAAHALELPRATVSAAVQQLEAQVGARLLHRTTRQVNLTADGAQLLARARAAGRGRGHGADVPGACAPGRGPVAH